MKNTILEENKGLSGIYRWVNEINDSSYVGSSVNLAKRFKAYFAIKYKSKPRDNIILCKSLAKNGLSAFRLEIIKYCDKYEVLKWEQYWMDILQPEYNILKVAGSSLGYKHTEENKAKMCQFHHNRHPIEVFNTKTNETKFYTSIRKAATEIGISRTTIMKYLKNKEEYKNYKFTYSAK
jgi:excinuclease UvrABC nuclease subunit